MTPIDKPRENIPLVEVGEDGNQYFEQYNFPVGAFKLGDCAYVKSDTGTSSECSLFHALSRY